MEEKSNMITIILWPVSADIHLYPQTVERAVWGSLLDVSVKVVMLCIQSY